MLGVGSGFVLMSVVVGGVIATRSALVPPDDPIRHDSSDINPGHYLSQGHFPVEITNGGFRDVNEVNIRSHWNIKPESRLDNQRDLTLVGKIPVGSTLSSIGEVKGIVGEFTTERPSNIFFAIPDSELRRLGFQFPPDRPEQNIYYINSRYARFLQTPIGS